MALAAMQKTQNAAVVMSSLSISVQRRCSEKTSAVKTKAFLVHCFGRIVRSRCRSVGSPLWTVVVFIGRSIPMCFCSLSQNFLR